MRARLETTGVHVVVHARRADDGDRRDRRSRGRARARARGDGRRRPRRADLAALQARLVASSPTTSRPCSTSTGAPVGGGETFCLIAGPCTVESREQTLEVARAVAGRGRLDAARRRLQAAHVAVRVQGPGRARRSRSSPRRARETGLPVVTELLDAEHAEAIAEHADVVQIGARNMQNYALLEVAGKLRQAGAAQARAVAPRSTSCCRPPTTSSRRATRP